MNALEPALIVILVGSIATLSVPALGQSLSSIQGDEESKRAPCELELALAVDKQVGNLLLTVDHEIYWNRTKLPLGEVSWRILVAMTSEPNTYISTAELVTAVYGQIDKEVGTNRIKVLIFKLRDKFEAVDPVFFRIQSKFGWGYIWLSDEVPGSTRMGDLEIRRDIEWVKWKGQFVKLTNSQFKTLDVLLGSAENWIGVYDLVQRLYGDQLDMYPIKVIVKRLRSDLDRLQQAFQKVDPRFRALEIEIRAGKGESYRLTISPH